MIERYENALQIIVLLVCSGISIYRAAVFRSRTWTISFFFFGSWALGDIYWLVCLIFYDESPQISVVSDLSWYAAFVFLYLVLIRTSPPQKQTHPLQWAGPVFAALMAVVFMTFGDILSNIIYAGLMGLLLYSSSGRLLNARHSDFPVCLPVMILTLCILEYGLWISSFFWYTGTLENVYYVIDTLVTVSFILFIPAIKKAVAS